MPMLMAGLEEPAVVPLPQHQSYPAQVKSANGSVNGVPTEVTSTMFSDRIMITISQEGRLGQWFQIALSPRDASTFTGLPQPDASTHYGSPADDDGGGTVPADDSMLPLPHLTARTLLGASTAERETVGQLYATQIASTIMARRPEETRVLLVGLGLGKALLDSGGGIGADDYAARAGFFDLLELAAQTL